MKACGTSCRFRPQDLRCGGMGPWQSRHPWPVGGASSSSGVGSCPPTPLSSRLEAQGRASYIGRTGAAAIGWAPLAIWKLLRDDEPGKAAAVDPSRDASP
ncbi:hypothetical protein FH972_022073 [Carpinus fangiana]|uniref:Uncharacterized protein n=1 Tax=Carpinus fangiana TaxID=176857 RepID=A0A5N6KRJ0_9ROSI|nr:hypothetical protein FH972_022073 [Carpinus fangiana]